MNQSTDISIPLQSGNENPNCFNAPVPNFEPVQAGTFIGDTRLGAPVNFYNVQLNPHGNGTHTECVGHIAQERFAITDCLKNFHSIGVLITVEPEKYGEDWVITKSLLEKAFQNFSGNEVTTLLVRTLPNTDDKLTRNYSGTNPAYFSTEAMEFIVAAGVEHLITDLPSVDREQDAGKLAAHHIFWQYPQATRLNATITEMVFIPEKLQDGWYLINLQIIPIMLDASPGKVLMFELKTK